MSSVEIDAINPIPLLAVVHVGGTVTVDYNVPPQTSVDEITDTFATLPASVTVNVTSSTVPSGYWLEAEGDGTWSTLPDGTLSGVFSVPSNVNSVTYAFTIIVTNGIRELARHDPRLVIRKATSR